MHGLNRRIDTFRFDRLGLGKMELVNRIGCSNGLAFGVYCVVFGSMVDLAIGYIFGVGVSIG